MMQIQTLSQHKSHNLAIIPARGGSKGIPGKNVKQLAGKSLIAHTIESAHRATHVHRIIVSTDSPQIAEIAKEYDAEIVYRPVEISTDNSSSESALLHVLEHLHQTEAYNPDLVIFLQCTSPLTAPEDIDGVVDALTDSSADTALSVAPFHYFLWEIDESGDASGINHDKKVRLLRQARNPQYIETGAVYVLKADLFREHKHRFFGKTAIYVMPNERCCEIDDPVDFSVAEVLIRDRQIKRRRIESLPDPISALVMDFDGVFTNNSVIVNQDGSEAVVCDRADGLGISRLKKTGIPILVLSAEENPVVTARCKKLGLNSLQGIQNKKDALKQWAESNNTKLANTIFLGNDINDLDCLQMVGCSVAVADAHPEVKRSSRMILTRLGGKGAIRELTDLILEKLHDNIN
jgi:N-acylneuraminate cytidylyltransferase